ncbi:HAD family hydrolase [Gaetbulibacter sp. 4G1]|nr:HAD family phosphatase [Gaetbulibacter sp. 4G1]PIA78672.1 HAD family hydrolase [Gaetbulibacter sp. 4G1]
MKIKNIIFDFGGVLIDANPRYFYQDVFNDSEKMELFLETICSASWNLKQDAGRSFSEATQELINKFPDYTDEIKLYYSNWPKMIKGPIKENVNLIDKLKIHYRLFGLTNWSAESFPIVYNQYPFFKKFEGIVVSGDEETIKPDIQIYNVLLIRYNLKAYESLFIDDAKENIEAADKLGFKTIHYKDRGSLKHELKKFNINI